MNRKIGLLAIATLPAMAQGRGVTPYLPLNLDPEVEREVERVLILGDKPALRRPIPAALVVEALPKACKVDVDLCERVRRYLSRYMKQAGIEFASVEASAGSGSNITIPNAHGEREQSHYQVSGAGYVQLGDYALVNVGGVAYEGKSATPTGSVISLGFDWAQLDIGYRDHWWSPTSNSSMLISTEAPTMPSVTLSNYLPLTRFGLEYELFVARMSYSTQIQTAPNGVLTQGYPKMAGIHVGIEPVSGWSVGANRVLIYGGGAAGGQSVSDLAKAFFDPSKAQSTGFGGSSSVIGKQEASVVSQFIFPGKNPFSVYAEYAANDTSTGSNFLFGKPALSMGIHLPRLGRFDITLETSTWEPTWYVHYFGPVQTGYGDGITNYHQTIGNWFGDQRVFGDIVGGETQLVRVGYEPSFGGRFEGTLRMLRNDSFYSAIPYYKEYMGSLSYSRPWHGYAIGGEIDAGRDVFGNHYERLAGFLRLGDALPSDGNSTPAPTEGASGDEPGSAVFVDVGVNANLVNQDILGDRMSTTDTPTQFGPHLGVGARRQVSQHQDLGVRLDADDVQGHLFLGFRALDYRYRFGASPLAMDVFVGAARYQTGLPAFSWYVGGGPEWRNILPGWDLGLNVGWGIKEAREREPGYDRAPPGGLHPDSFYDVYTVNLHLSHKL